MTLQSYAKARACFSRRGTQLAGRVGQHTNNLRQLRPQQCYSTEGQQQQVIIQGGCYEETVNILAQRTIVSFETPSSGSRLIVGIAGAPGSGKSTLATLVCHRINELQPPKGDAVASVVPMDGFHYYRRELDAMPDPEEAHARRGAPWTFNAAAFVDCVRRVRAGGRVMVPSFDHGVGDPVADDIQVAAGCGIVLVEGNYLLLPDAPWAELRPLFDEAWFVDCPLDVAMDRVLARQVANGAAREVAEQRVRSNDLPNAEQVAATKQYAQVVVPSTVPFNNSAAAK